MNAFAYTDTLYNIHEIQHLHDDLLTYIRHNRPEGDIFCDTRFEDLIFKFLKVSKDAINRLINGDVAVHIKFCVSQKKEGSGVLKPENIFLQTCYRVPSYRENAMLESGELRAREDEEKFCLLFGKEGTIAELVKNKEKYNEGIVKVNSAYNCVFRGNEHFYICNDLIREEQKGLYFSTSKEWKLFYRALAVFLIYKDVQDHKNLNHEMPCGLFIVDSYEQGCFDKAIIKAFAGYIAHKLFNIFEQIAAKNYGRRET